MNRTINLALMALLLFSLASCGSNSAPSTEDAELAFQVSFVAVFTPAIALTMGQELAGASMDAETGELTLTDFDLTPYVGDEASIPYTTVSGTAGNDSNGMIVDLTLVGGPIETISYSMTGDQMGAEDTLAVTVTVDGVEVDLEMASTEPEPTE